MINFVDRIIQQSPYLVNFYVAKGDLLFLKGNLLEAELAYRRALELFPLHNIAHQRLEELRMIREGTR
jgi:tetratricopeptide (TPR) repeat protein